MLPEARRGLSGGLRQPGWFLGGLLAGADAVEQGGQVTWRITVNSPWG